MNNGIPHNIDTGRMVSLIPVNDIKSGAIDQLKGVLALDDIVKVAVMPDIHMGSTEWNHSLPIGVAALSDGFIYPPMVGSDIGCGMCMTVTDIDVKTLSDKDKADIFVSMYDNISVGVGGKSFSDNQRNMNTFSVASRWMPSPVINRINRAFETQCGTLGGGNHFIEIGSYNEKLCVVVHSGSRGPGKMTADVYCDKMQPYGGRIPADSPIGQAYISDLLNLQKFALANRSALMRQTLSVIGLNDYDIMVVMSKMINENHNHAEHVGNNMWLHRKGCTSANKGQYGVIPGNMRDGVYVTCGLGNETFLNSASHGAGRVASRSKTKELAKDLYGDNADAFSSAVMQEFGDVLAPFHPRVSDELPLAYKDLDTVVKYQDGVVVTVVGKATPLINIKGLDNNRRGNVSDKSTVVELAKNIAAKWLNRNTNA